MPLNFEGNPPIKTYQYNAYALGAVLGIANSSMSVVYNNFIQIEAANTLSNKKHPLYFCPNIGPKTFQRAGLGLQLNFEAINKADLINAINIAIGSGFFIRLLVDEYYIPNRWTHLHHHRRHDILVTHINRDLTTISLYGYRKDHRYGESICSIEEIAKAYFAKIHESRTNGFIAFSADRHRLISVDLPRIKEHLTLLLQSKPFRYVDMGGLRTANETKQYGLTVFNVLEEYIRNDSTKDYFDARPFSVLQEHAEVMLGRTIHVGRLLGRTPNLKGASNSLQLSRDIKLMSMLSQKNRDIEVKLRMLRLCNLLKENMRIAAESLYTLLE